MKKKTSKYLYDALSASKSILDFVYEKDFLEYQQNEMLQSAVERKFEIIGESLNRVIQIDEEFLTNNLSDVHKIIGFRNILIHGYDIIDNEFVWNAIEKHLPILVKELSDILSH